MNINESFLLYQNGTDQQQFPTKNEGAIRGSFSPPIFYGHSIQKHGYDQNKNNSSLIPLKPRTRSENVKTGPSYGSEYSSKNPSLNQTINPFEFKKVLSQIKIENKAKQVKKAAPSPDKTSQKSSNNVATHKFDSNYLVYGLQNQSKKKK